MAAASQRAALQTALLSIRGLRRRKLGHVGANAYNLDLDKWGRRKNLNGGGGTGVPSNLLGAGMAKRPAPRASLVLGGQRPVSRRKNGLNGAAAAAAKPRLNGGGDANGRRLRAGMMEQQLTSMSSRRYVMGSSHTNGLAMTAEDAPPNKLNGEPSTQTNGEDPQTRGGKKSDLVVVLDMDECLIHSQFLSDQMVDKYRQYEDRPPTASFQQGRHEEPVMWSTCESFRINLPDGDLVNVNKRPNLDLFLDEITSRFETYIFTAAMEVYAAPVLDKLDPHGEKFRGRFFREHCVYDENMGTYSKDLCDVLRLRKMMIDDAATAADNDRPECDERRVVLVDNNPLSFLPNPSNGILVSSFYDDPKDDTLEAVMELLHELDESEDVRPILDDRFGLKDALDDVMKGASTGW